MGPVTRRKRRGSGRGEIFLWEKALIWMQDKWNRIAAFLLALGEVAHQFFKENQASLMAALPFWAAAAILVVLGAVVSSRKIEVVKNSDNTERRVV